ncbi:heparin lyase I family protein [Pedobacter kyungheensis]|uniref:heparin lyase I family protein n=1 Tax=Pedobacter kyungheensis TaxID=1069985 RepID=UPI00068DAD5B|nr:heparin lyase I family protein [Pedobacter kyungheensis]
MNKQLLHSISGCAAAAMLFFTVSCKKANNTVQPVSEKNATARAATVAGDTILNATYENNSLNSGYPLITPTEASAADAVYMVSPGATGNYAVAHKVVAGDSSYFSAGNWRSESALMKPGPARFSPGQERRYEFSMLLKDFPVSQAEKSEQFTLFQLKNSAEGGALRIIRKGNTIQTARAGNTFHDLLVSNFAPYVNQWMHFRIDVKWAEDNTGYMKIYTKLPGQTTYTMVLDAENCKTYFGGIGYLKWGVYNPPLGSTRIVYHDDIRIIALN